MIVLPCPGPSAWRAPKAKASRSDTASTIGVSRQLTSAAKDFPELTADPSTLPPSASGTDPTPEPWPGRNDRLAEVTWSGLDSSDTG